MASSVICVRSVMSDTPACGFLKPSRQSALTIPRLDGGAAGAPAARPAFFAPARFEITMVVARTSGRAWDGGVYSGRRSCHHGCCAQDPDCAAHRRRLPQRDRVPHPRARRYRTWMARRRAHARAAAGAPSRPLRAPDGAGAARDDQHGHADDVVVRQYVHALTQSIRSRTSSRPRTRQGS